MQPADFCHTALSNTDQPFEPLADRETELIKSKIN